MRSNCRRIKHEEHCTDGGNDEGETGHLHHLRGVEEVRPCKDRRSNAKSEDDG